jgi:hypothetical protein
VAFITRGDRVSVHSAKPAFGNRTCYRGNN